jgi:tetratricopeptide (TPR) repeat protein
MLSATAHSGAQDTPHRSSVNAADGCYAFSPSPGTDASSYLSAMDRWEEFNYHVPTKHSPTPPASAASEANPHAPDGYAAQLPCLEKQLQTIRSVDNSSSNDVLTRSAADAAHSATRTANLTQHWVEELPISPIHASRTPMRRVERDLILSHAADSGRNNAQSPSATPTHVAAPASAPAEKHVIASSSSPALHNPDSGVAALRLNLHALLQQAAPASTLDEKRDTTLRGGPAKSNTNTESSVGSLSHSPQVSSRNSPDSQRQLDQRPRSSNSSHSGTGLPPPLAVHANYNHTSSEKPAMHFAAVWPRLPPPRVGTRSDDPVKGETPPVAPRRPGSASNAFRSPTANSKSRENDGDISTTRSSPSRRQRPSRPCVPSMSDDPLMRAIATGQPYGLHLLSSNSDASSTEHSRSRVRHDVQQARAQQDFEAQAGQLARLLDEKLEHVFALMRRIMALDARIAISARGETSSEHGDDEGGAAGSNCSSSRASNNIYEDRDTDEFRDTLVRQLEAVEDETMSCTLRYVELINRHALQWMNEKHFSAALQLLMRADGLLRKDAGRVFRYLPAPVELQAALFSSTTYDAAAASRARSADASAPTLDGETGTDGVSYHKGNEDVRSINVPFFPPSQELARLKAAAAVEHNLGIYHFKIGEYAIAASRLARAALLEEELHAPGIGITYFNMAQAQHELQDLPEALRYVTLAEEAVERQVFVSKDAATQLRRHLAQRRAFTVADLLDDPLATVETDVEALLSNVSASSTDASPREEPVTRTCVSSGEPAEMYRRALPGVSTRGLLVNVNANATSETQRNAARDRELLQLWMQWREGVCFMSYVKQTHAEWLNEMGQHKASYQQYQQAHRWLVSVPRLSPEEQQRAQKLKEHMAKEKRKWRREEVEIELYHRPLPTHSSAGGTRAAGLRTCLTPTHRTGPSPVRVLPAQQQQRQGRGGRLSGAAPATRVWRGLSTPLQSTVVTSVLPRAVEVVGGARRRHYLPSHPPPHPVYLLHDGSAAAEGIGTAATVVAATSSSCVIAPSPVSGAAAAARRRRPNSANAALYSAYMYRPSSTQPHPQRRGSGELGDAGRDLRDGFAAHPPLAPDAMATSTVPPRTSEKLFTRPEWNPSTRVPVPPPERRPATSWPTSGANSRRSSVSEFVAHRNSDSALSGSAAVRESDVRIASATSHDTRRAVEPLSEALPCPVPPVPPQQGSASMTGHDTPTGAPESVVRSLLFDVGVETPKRPPGRPHTPQLPHDEAAVEMETDKDDSDVDDTVEGDDDEEEEDGSSEAEENSGEEEKGPLSIRGKDTRDEEEEAGEGKENGDSGDDAVVSVSSSEASSVVSKRASLLPLQPRASRPRGDLTWCVTVLQAFLRSRTNAECAGRASPVNEEDDELALDDDERHSASLGPADVTVAAPTPHVLVRQETASDDGVEAKASNEEAEERRAASVSPTESVSRQRSAEVVVVPHVELLTWTPGSATQSAQPLTTTIHCESSHSSPMSTTSLAITDDATKGAAECSKTPHILDQHQTSAEVEHHDSDSQRLSHHTVEEDVTAASPNEAEVNRSADGTENFAQEEEQEAGSTEASATRRTPLSEKETSHVEEVVTEGARCSDKGDENNREIPVVHANDTVDAGVHDAAGEHAPHVPVCEGETAFQVVDPPHERASGEDNDASLSADEAAQRCDEAELRPAHAHASADAVVASDENNMLKAINAEDSDLTAVSNASDATSSLDHRGFISADALVDSENEEGDEVKSSSLFASSDQYGSASSSAANSSLSSSSSSSSSFRGGEPNDDVPTHGALAGDAPVAEAANPRGSASDSEGEEADRNVANTINHDSAGTLALNATEEEIGNGWEASKDQPEIFSVPCEDACAPSAVTATPPSPSVAVDTFCEDTHESSRREAANANDSKDHFENEEAEKKADSADHDSDGAAGDTKAVDAVGALPEEGTGEHNEASLPAAEATAENEHASENVNAVNAEPATVNHGHEDGEERTAVAEENLVQQEKGGETRTPLPSSTLDAEHDDMHCSNDSQQESVYEGSAGAAHKACGTSPPRKKLEGDALEEAEAPLAALTERVVAGVVSTAAVHVGFTEGAEVSAIEKRNLAEVGKEGHGAVDPLTSVSRCPPRSNETPSPPAAVDQRQEEQEEVPLLPDLSDGSTAEVHLLTDSSSSPSSSSSERQTEGGVIGDQPVGHAGCDSLAEASDHSAGGAKTEAAAQLSRTEEAMKACVSAGSYADADDPGNLTFAHPNFQPRRSDNAASAVVDASTTVGEGHVESPAAEAAAIRTTKRETHRENDLCASPDSLEQQQHQHPQLTASTNESLTVSRELHEGGSSDVAPINHEATTHDDSAAVTERSKEDAVQLVPPCEKKTTVDTREGNVDHLDRDRHLFSASHCSQSGGAALIVGVLLAAHTADAEGHSLPPEACGASRLRSFETEGRPPSSEVVLLMASAHSSDNGPRISSDVLPTKKAAQPHGSQSSNSRPREVKIMLKGPEQACQSLPTPVPRRSRVFVFAPPRVATPATADLTQFSATSPARSEDNERSNARDDATAVNSPAEHAKAAAATAVSGATPTSDACTGTVATVLTAPTAAAVRQATEEANRSASLVHLSPSLTTGSPDAPLSFTECFYCDVPPEEEGAGRRTWSSNSTATQVSQLRASFWRSMHERGDFKVEDGVLHSLRSPLRQAPNLSTSLLIAPAAARARVSTTSAAVALAAAAAAAVEKGPPSAALTPPAAAVDATSTEVAEAKTRELRAFQRQLICHHDIDIVGDADAPPFCALSQPPAKVIVATAETVTGSTAHLECKSVPTAAAAVAEPSSKVAACVSADEAAETEEPKLEKRDQTKVQEESKGAASSPSSALPSSASGAVILETASQREHEAQDDECTAESTHSSSPLQPFSADHDASRSVVDEGGFKEQPFAEEAVSAADYVVSPSRGSNSNSNSVVSTGDADGDGSASAAWTSAKRAFADNAALRGDHHHDGVDKEAACLVSPSPLPEAKSHCSPSLPFLQEGNVQDSLRGSQSPTRAPVNQQGANNASDDNDSDEDGEDKKTMTTASEDAVAAEDAERDYLRKRILREEAATVIQQAWQRCMARRRPQPTYTTW